MSSLIFFRVRENRAKLNALIQTAQKYFFAHQKILFAVPNHAAAEYLDQLFWSTPVESFLPHVVADQPTKSAIAITASGLNVNQAEILFNLCPAITPLFPGSFCTYYDFYDLTHSEKEKLSEKREAAYRAVGLIPTYL